ncbi:thioredoxin reductase [Methanobrevibacter woesei]|uniref:Thioredoxin reductase n=1 Tax=Methanobrevibacter woesei TaxID=190976 RepID=A0A2U1S9P9_9EURY|nr:thioredoxin-disulfide reductase [Methanobrevibacter woesei]MCC9260776.1 thioredoxin-disulfide reductase [Methanobrevibacter woesei]PWB87148.1 thioredoxin reductase [Methanobrevibacter woesei]
MEKYDIIIVGAGPGGLTAGIYAGRQGTKTLILDKNLAGGIGREVPEMENYPGFDLVSGLELAEKMKNQCVKNVELHENEGVNTIEKIEDNDYNFKVESDEHSYLTKTVIIATGSSHQQLNIPGEEEFKGRGVSYCATCDGMFFAGKDIAMVGGGNSALQEAVFLSNLGCNVTVIHRREEFRAEQYLQDKLKEKGIKTIMNATVEEIKGDMLVNSITIKDKESGELKDLEVNGVFISVGYKPHTKLAEELGVDLDKNNQIITDKNQKTNINYVYSAGDVCGGVKQWVVACGEGAIAATSAYKDIENS